VINNIYLFAGTALLTACSEALEMQQRMTVVHTAECRWSVMNLWDCY